MTHEMIIALLLLSLAQIIAVIIVILKFTALSDSIRTIKPDFHNPEPARENDGEDVPPAASPDAGTRQYRVVVAKWDEVIAHARQPDLPASGDILDLYEQHRETHPDVLPLDTDDLYLLFHLGEGSGFRECFGFASIKPREILGAERQHLDLVMTFGEKLAPDWHLTSPQDKAGIWRAIARELPWDTFCGRRGWEKILNIGEDDAIAGRLYVRL